MEVNVNELTGPALDWAVGMAVGAFKWGADGEDLEIHVCDRKSDGRRYFWTENHSGGYSPSTDWEQGGPLIDEHLADLIHDGDYWVAICFSGYADNVNHGVGRHCDSKLIAVCRAIVVANKLGPIVNVPDELL